jgi:hypothetical protein
LLRERQRREHRKRPDQALPVHPHELDADQGGEQRPGLPPGAEPVLQVVEVGEGDTPATVGGFLAEPDDDTRRPFQGAPQPGGKALLAEDTLSAGSEERILPLEVGGHVAA